MALVDIDSWLTEFDACERLSRDIQSEIVVRNQQNRLSELYTKLTTSVRFKLKQFSTQLKQLNINLNDSLKRASITEQEGERRQRQIENLQSSLIHLQNQFSNVEKNTEREELLNGNKNVSLWEDDDDEPMIDTKPSSSKGKNYSVDDLRKQQTKILEDQNEGLEALSKVISRQKNLALRIGDEVDDQNEILDDLAVTIDNTDARINNETRNVGFVIQKESTKYYWFIIISLFIANLIVAII